MANRIISIALLALLLGAACAANDRKEVKPAPADVGASSIDYNSVSYFPVVNDDCKATCQQQGLISPVTAQNTPGVTLCAVPDADGTLYPGSTVRGICKAVVFVAGPPPKWSKVVKLNDGYQCGCISVFRPATPWNPQSQFYGNCPAPTTVRSQVCRFKLPTNGYRTSEWRYGWTDGAVLSLPNNAKPTFIRACNVVGIEDVPSSNGDGVVSKDVAVYATENFQVMC